MNIKRKILKILPDKLYLELMFKRRLGYKLDLKNPKTFNEKLQWLKLYDRKPIYTTMVDKYEAKKYVADKIGEQYIIPTLGVWDDPDEIDFDALPNQFVLKCNHNSGLGMCICKDKSKLDIESVKVELRKGLKQNYYLSGREWPYKNVKRKIIAEKYIENFDLGDLRDYKIHCFAGIPKFIQVIGNRNISAHTGNQMFYTGDWEPAGWSFGDYSPYPNELDEPHQLNKMYEIASSLSMEHSYLRVDLYEINNQIYFGELTFYPGCGLYPYNGVYNKETDMMLGALLELPKEKRE